MVTTTHLSYGYYANVENLPAHSDIDMNTDRIIWPNGKNQKEKEVVCCESTTHVFVYEFI